MKHRLFLAIDLPIEFRSSVANLYSQLDSLKLPVDWEPVEKLHMTLNFLGKVDGGLIPSILKSVGDICRQTSIFNLQPYFMETLYSRHQRSLIYLLPIGDTQILADFQKQISATLNDLKLPQPGRFLPHFTIGRLQRTDPVSTKKFLDQVEELDFSPLPSFLVEKITLYESLISRAGSKYVKLHHLPLG